MSTSRIACLAWVHAYVVRPGRIVALGLLFSQLGGTALPLCAWAQREIHACGCVGMCVCGHAERDATACPRSFSSDTPSLARCLHPETSSPPSRMIASELFILELPILSRVLEDEPPPNPMSVRLETDPPPPRF